MILETGMYVRTKEGYIAKCIYIDKELENIYGFDDVIRRSFGDTYDFIYCKEQEKYITNSSYNIIDLIEVGDYVNGYKVRGTSVSTLLLDNFNMIKIEDYEIKSIVTKEQFENMSYRLGSEE